MFQAYHGAALVAQVGSWDRTIPSGYAVTAVPFAPAARAPTGAAAELLSFRFDPPVQCNVSADCPGNATCQRHSPAAYPVPTGEPGAIGRPAGDRA